MPNPGTANAPAGATKDTNRVKDYGFNSKHKHCVTNGAAKSNQLSERLEYLIAEVVLWFAHQ